MNNPEFDIGLDNKPDDWALRSVYADWLEEHGDQDGSLTQRWMVREERTPVQGSNETFRHWYYGLEPHLKPVLKKEYVTKYTFTNSLYSLLPRNIYDLIIARRHIRDFWTSFDSRIKAEEALKQALKTLGIIKGDYLMNVPDKIYIVYENSDGTEGRGPMVQARDSGFFTDEGEAWDFADTLCGIMGRKPLSGTWRKEKYPDVEVRTFLRHNCALSKEKAQLKIKIEKLQEQLRELEK